MTKRILVCGSRDWNEDDMIMEQVLSGLVDTYGPDITIIEGAAKGADHAAAVLAEQIGLNVEEYPADWSMGKRAGYVRNKQMLDEGKPDLVLAFVNKPLADSRGTAMMVDIANAADVPTYVIQRYKKYSK